MSGKMYAMIVLHHVGEQADSKLLASQYAFGKSSGLTDSVCTVCFIMYKH
jgi:hypothetical protein